MSTRQPDIDGNVITPIIYASEATVTRITIPKGLLCEWWSQCHGYARFYIDGGMGNDADVCHFHLGRGIDLILGTYDMME